MQFLALFIMLEPARKLLVDLEIRLDRRLNCRVKFCLGVGIVEERNLWENARRGSRFLGKELGGGSIRRQLGRLILLGTGHCDGELGGWSGSRRGVVWDDAGDFVAGGSRLRILKMVRALRGLQRLAAMLHEGPRHSDQVKSK